MFFLGHNSNVSNTTYITTQILTYNHDVFVPKGNKVVLMPRQNKAKGHMTKTTNESHLTSFPEQSRGMWTVWKHSC